MSDGEISIWASGDIAGYGMRGGGLYIRDNAGIAWHMKAIRQKPGHCCGRSGRGFCGEIWPGTIIVLGLTAAITPQLDLIAERHAGEIYIRGEV